MFMVVYAILIGLTAYFVDKAFSPAELRHLPNPIFGQASVTMLISIFSAVGMSMFYANIIVNYRKTEIATLKCLGWRNSHVLFLVSGEIFSVTLLAFFFVVETFIHTTAISAFYLLAAPAVPPTTIPATIVYVQIWPIVITFGIMLGVQILGIIIANYKVLRVRPIQALQRM